MRVRGFSGVAALSKAAYVRSVLNNVSHWLSLRSELARQCDQTFPSFLNQSHSEPALITQWHSARCNV